MLFSVIKTNDNQGRFCEGIFVVLLSENIFVFGAGLDSEIFLRFH